MNKILKIYTNFSCFKTFFIKKKRTIKHNVVCGR